MSALGKYTVLTPVNELPLWDACPWRPFIDKRFSIHRAEIEGIGDLGVVYDSENELHISAEVDSFVESNMQPAMLNLCGCAWEKKFGVGVGRPDLYNEILAKQAGLPSSLSDEEFAAARAQYDKMHLWQAAGLPGSQSVN